MRDRPRSRRPQSTPPSAASPTGAARGCGPAPEAERTTDGTANHGALCRRRAPSPPASRPGRTAFQRRAAQAPRAGGWAGAAEGRPAGQPVQGASHGAGSAGRVLGGRLASCLNVSDMSSPSPSAASWRYSDIPEAPPDRPGTASRSPALATKDWRITAGSVPQPPPCRAHLCRQVAVHRALKSLLLNPGDFRWVTHQTRCMDNL